MVLEENMISTVLFPVTQCKMKKKTHVIDFVQLIVP